MNTPILSTEDTAAVSEWIRLEGLLDTFDTHSWQFESNPTTVNAVAWIKTRLEYIRPKIDRIAQLLDSE